MLDVVHSKILIDTDFQLQEEQPNVTVDPSQEHSLPDDKETDQENRHDIQKLKNIVDIEGGNQRRASHISNTQKDGNRQKNHRPSQVPSLPEVNKYKKKHLQERNK